jgi:trans-aconitate 3-methyltransferase
MAPAVVEKPSLSIPNGKQDDAMSDSSKVASPTDSENAEKNMAALEAKMNGKLQITTPTVTDAPPQQDINNDPLSATALTSPLHTINWDNVRTGSLDSIANNAFPDSWATSNNSAWEAFKRTGPRYPPSLEKLVMDYHHRHSKSWQLAHDMGAGSGVYSPVLARYFRHVHVSDPSNTGLATSRQALSTWSAENKKSRGRFTFTNTKPEAGHESVADKTVDMVVMMEGAHFSNPEVMVRSAAQSLAKDGTLALISYSPICRVTGNPGANEAVQRLFNAWGPQPWDVVCGDARGKKNFSQGLDFVPLPEDIFDSSKTRRITINSSGKGSGAFSALVPNHQADASDNRVRNGERKHEYSSEGADEQARGWRQEVGPEFFRSMTAALVGQGAMQQFEKTFQEIQKIVHETSPNGIMITVEWTVAVVLATKK